jgi:hypothetical protein
MIVEEIGGGGGIGDGWWCGGPVRQRGHCLGRGWLASDGRGRRRRGGRGRRGASGGWGGRSRRASVWRPVCSRVTPAKSYVN